MFSTSLLVHAADFLATARARDLTVATAESCTGGLIAALLTEIPGSSDVVYGGAVVYSNAAKTRLLDVSDALLSEFGAVSAPVARAMAQGILGVSGADLSIAVTGVAGPAGGSAEKPVGLVHFAAMRRSGEMLLDEKRFGTLTRREIRLLTVENALALLRAML